MKNNAATDNSGLSNCLPLEECLAKTYFDTSTGKKVKGRNILDHSLIAGDIATQFLNLQPSWLFSNFNINHSHIIAALHDIGKITPLFQCKLCETLGNIPTNLTNIQKDIPLEQTYGYHSGASQIALDDIKYNLRTISEIVGRHHGKNNRPKQDKSSELLGGKSWQQLRDELLNKVLQYFNYDEIPEIFNKKNKSNEFISFISGLVVVADWLASSDIFNNPLESWQDKTENILKNTGFFKPEICKNLSFSDIFGFTPRPEQEILSNNFTEQDVYIVEAQTGSGKTEAALNLAYKLLEQGKAQGIYFALPTKLTSNKIYQRFNQFLSKILKTPTLATGMLVHGDSRLYDDIYFPDEEGKPNVSWFLHNKRGILYPFAVGTIDQALMSVLNVKHYFVRTFGLAGKVVILDEVHSYDMYTGTVINELVKQLKNMQCTVIILSATLTEKRRVELLSIDTRNTQLLPYPLISSASKSYTPTISDNYNVKIDISSKDSMIIETILEKAENGEQVLWIENTVDDAQEIYKLVNSRSVAGGLPIDVGLLHSGYIKKDRQQLENKWVNIFGKDSEIRNTTGRILIGTQILEQSLDIDADLVVSRLAPIDMILQRIGRLWRHKNNRPKSAERKIIILSPEYKETSGLFGKSGYIYAPYILSRTYNVLKTLNSISIPTDVRKIMEDVYNDDYPCNEIEQKWKFEMVQQAENLKRLALKGLSDGNTDDEDASTRYSEIKTVNLLLLKNYSYTEDTVSLDFFTGEQVTFKKSIITDDRKLWRNILNLIISNTVAVADYKAPNISYNIDWLKNFLYIGNSQKKHSGIAIVDKNDSLCDCFKNNDSNDTYFLEYNSTVGYKANKK